MNFKILNKKQSDNLLKDIKQNYIIDKIDIDCGFIEKSNKIFIISRDISRIDFRNMRLNDIGLYFCKVEKDGIRLSIEGSQLVGENAKNSIILDEEETKKWFSGEDIQDKEGYGYFIVKNKKDILGCGKVKEGKLYNFVPKERRIELFRNLFK